VHVVLAAVRYAVAAGLQSSHAPAMRSRQRHAAVAPSASLHLHPSRADACRELRAFGVSGHPRKRVPLPWTANSSYDDMFLGFRARALSESAVARYALRPPPRACADAVSRAAWAWQARRPMLRRRSTSQATTRRTCRGATAGALLQCIRYVCQDSERGGSRVQPAPPQTACGRCTANKWPTP
jgi:hypothetical protein